MTLTTPGPTADRLAPGEVRVQPRRRQESVDSVDSAACQPIHHCSSGVSPVAAANPSNASTTPAGQEPGIAATILDSSSRRRTVT